MFGMITQYREEMTDVERIARCICSAMHGSDAHWALYKPAAVAVLSKYWVDTGQLGSRCNSSSLF